MEEKVMDENFCNLEKIIATRDLAIKKHFGAYFLSAMTSLENQSKYEQFIAPIDAKIVFISNDISKINNWNITYKTITDVFKDRTLSVWYMEQRKEFMRDFGYTPQY